MSKVDPKKLENVHNLDRKSALLIRVANQEIEKAGGGQPVGGTVDDEPAKIEEPGLDVRIIFFPLSRCPRLRCSLQLTSHVVST